MYRNMRKATGLALVGLCPLLYALSLMLPAFDPLIPRQGGFPGWLAFKIGFGALTGPWYLDSHLAWMAASWLANPMIWAGLGCSSARRWSFARWFGLAGIGFSLIPLMRWPGACVEMPGYWMWVASALALAIGSWLLALHPSSTSSASKTPPE